MNLSSKLAGIKAPKKEYGPDNPLWAGPCGEGPNGGITYSLLCKFLNCRERFKATVVHGLRPNDGFNHRIQYGHMWHLCEEAYAAQEDIDVTDETFEPLARYVASLYRKYPTQQEQISHWYDVCKTQFPLYIKYWASQQDVLDRKPIFQEQVFDIPYRLPSGRKVRLRAKLDSADVIGKGKNAGIYLQENKTKGDVRENQILRQLTFDLQTMIYMTILCQWAGTPGLPPVAVGVPVRGVRYNVIRRPLSGGKGTIVRHKPTKSNPQGESKEEYYGRLATIIEENPQDFFMRWKVEVSAGDIRTFWQQCLDPILEQLCTWYDVVVLGKSPGRIPAWAMSWRHPFGVFNVLDEGGSTDLDEWLVNGSTAGLEVVDNLFPELNV